MPTLYALSVPDQKPLKRKDAKRPKTEKRGEDDLRPEYDFDFSNADRGRYAKRSKTEGADLVLVEPDLAQAFPDSASVNAALRSVVEFAKLSPGITKRSTVRVAKRRAT